MRLTRKDEMFTDKFYYITHYVFLSQSYLICYRENSVPLAEKENLKGKVLRMEELMEENQKY